MQFIKKGNLKNALKEIESFKNCLGYSWIWNHKDLILSKFQKDIAPIKNVSSEINHLRNVILPPL